MTGASVTAYFTQNGNTAIYSGSPTAFIYDGSPGCNILIIIQVQDRIN
jgi:hypothetical protein